MKKLKSKKLDMSLKDNFDKQKPILGICLGYQILFEKSNEGEEVEGLGLLKGNFVNFNEVSDNVKIPHTGWNVCKIQQKSKLFQGVENNSDFYFTHSYVLKNYSTKDILTTTDYNIDFVSSVSKTLWRSISPREKPNKRPQDFKKFHKYLLNAKKRLIITLTFKNGVLYRTKKFIPDYRYTKNFVGLFSIDELI